MTKAILTVIAIVTASYAFAQGIPLAQPSGRFQGVADSQGGVWRLDTVNGQLLRCNGVQAPICIVAIK